MREGLLWQDDSEGNLEVRLRRAAVGYLTKYGRPPNRCHVHPDVLGEVEIIPLDSVAPGVTIVADPMVRPNELWIGFVGEE